MNKTKNQRLTPFSKRLRKEMTKEEKTLWYDFLKKSPETFNRQKVIGKYIVDFYCAKAKLVIEIDGAQHYEEDAKNIDQQRDTYLNEKGLRVLRFSNFDVRTNFEGVCLEILKYVPTASPWKET